MRSRKFLKCIQRLLCLCLLKYANDSIRYEDYKNDQRVCDAFTVHIAGHSGYDGGKYQHDDHEALELADELLPEGRVFCLLKFVESVPCLSCSGFTGRQSFDRICQECPAGFSDIQLM